MANDEDSVEYALGRSDDKKIWQVTLRASTKLTEEEFAAACISLGKDILDGKISVDEFIEAVDPIMDSSLN